MRSLFFKLFLSFILITLLTSFTTAMVSHWLQIGPYRGMKSRLEKFQSRTLSNSLAATGIAVVKILENSGKETVISYLRELEEETHYQFFVLNRNGTLSNREIPPALKSIVTASQQSQTSESIFSETEIMAAQPLRDTNGQTLLIAGIAKKRIRPPTLSRTREGLTSRTLPLPLRMQFFWIGVMILLTAVACYLLARSLTAPIRRLRNATQQIGKGDFSVRVEQYRGKGDEVADLSYDFNIMTERTQSILQSQKRLLRDISHELRSPLTRLNIALELVRQQCAQAKPNVTRIENESRKLNELIEQLLTLTRLESTLNNAPRQAVNLKKMLTTIVHDADFEAASRNRRVTIPHLDEVTIPASREMLNRALENVIRNGLQYTASGTNVEVCLSTGKGHLTIHVQDHGPGVPEKYLEHIFEPFFRVEEARDRDSGGTGIGLAIAKQAIVMHGGSIIARNRETGGLLVEISLPL